MGSSIAGAVAGTLQHSSDVPHRLPNPMLVLDQRETHIALTSLAEAIAQSCSEMTTAERTRQRKSRPPKRTGCPFSSNLPLTDIRRAKPLVGRLKSLW
jgi:hypothetical protein